ncbi:MAG: hypothetical protein F4Y38_07065 [Gemmatimonadetes bacterium]|nr:hypothetical protein [Gemmatimonadota bacterium]MYG84324.1 hypothetical protein [Gemmatimonadota bacterium]MYJ88586.1 hypothetical protein [Gemmatimonadota bacterium]
MIRRIWRLIGYVLCSLFIGTYPATHYASPGDAAPGNAAQVDEDCYVEIASIDFGDGSGKLENNRFRHVFQYIDTHPYYRRVSDVYVGIETVRYFPNSTRPNRSYWSIVDGRKGVGAEEHYSLIQDFRGEANVLGVAVGINVADEFAFFLYDRNSDTNAGHYAHGARDGLLGVMTTIENKAEFINVEKASSWRIGSNTKLRAWSARFVDSDGDWNEGIYSNKLFRTLYFINSKVTVAGVEREVNKICRLAWSPVVVTNSDKLVPAIEAELARRADRIHALRIVNNEVPASPAEWRAAFNSLRPETFIHVLTVPRNHSGDIGVITEVGEIAITFTRDPYSDLIYYRPEKVWRLDGAQHNTTPGCITFTFRDVCPLTDGTWDGSSKP